jgi:hypothetical protein
MVCWSVWNVSHRSALAVAGGVDPVGGAEVCVDPLAVSVGAVDPLEVSVGAVVDAVVSAAVEPGLVAVGVGEVAVGPVVAHGVPGFVWALVGPAGTANRVARITMGHSLAIARLMRLLCISLPPKAHPFTL